MSSEHTDHPLLTTSQAIALWQNPFTTLPSEIIKRIMHYVAAQNVVDFYPENIHSPKHSVWPVLLTSKQFYRELSGLIYEKQDIINIVIDGSKRDETRPYMPRGFATGYERICATRWQSFKNVRFHLKPGLHTALTNECPTTRPVPRAKINMKSVAKESENCKRVVLGAFYTFCVFLSGISYESPKIKGPTKVDVLFHEAEESLAGPTPSLTPGNVMKKSHAPFWTLADLAQVVNEARMLRDLQISRHHLCICNGSIHNHTRPWRHDPRPEVVFYLPNVAYVVQANHSVFEENGARRHCSKLLERWWYRPEELIDTKGISAEDLNEVQLQGANYSKWLMDGDGEFRCLVIQGLELP